MASTKRQITVTGDELRLIDEALDELFQTRKAEYSDRAGEWSSQARVMYDAKTHQIRRLRDELRA